MLSSDADDPLLWGAARSIGNAPYPVRHLLSLRVLRLSPEPERSNFGSFNRNICFGGSNRLACIYPSANIFDSLCDDATFAPMGLDLHVLCCWGGIVLSPVRLY